MTVIHQERRTLTLEQLPADILLIVLQDLNIASISSLAKTCRLLYAFVSQSHIIK
jgi:hypothetical protein